MLVAVTFAVAPALARADTRPLPPEYSTAVGPGFVVGYHPSARERVERLVPRIAAARAELEWQTGRPFPADVDIRIAGLDVELPQLAGVDAFDDPELVTREGGVLIEAEGLVALSAGPGLDGAQRDLEVALRHQLARFALRSAVPQGLPGWFLDGYAAQFAHGAELSRSVTLAWAAVRGDLPHVGQDVREDDVSRALAAEAVRFVVESDGGRGMQRWTAAMRDGAAFDDAIAVACGDVATLDRGVRDRVTGRIAWFLVLVVALGIGIGAGVMAGARRRRRSLARARARAAVQEPALELIDPILGASEPVVDHAAIAVVRANPERVHHDGSWHTVH